MLRCPVCYNTFSTTRSLGNHACGTAVDRVGELAKKLEALVERVDAQERQIRDLQAEVKRGGLLPEPPPLAFDEGDMLALAQNGLKAFVRRHQWPVGVLGKTVYFHEDGAWVEMTPTHMKRLAAAVTKQLSILLMAYVQAEGLLESDPEGRFPEYSQNVHGMEPGQLKKAILDCV